MAEKDKTKPEDEYFVREDAVNIAKLRARLDKERKEREEQMLKEAHWMRCPKCGHKMREFPFKSVIVDRCDHCNYTGFDAGELELVAGKDQSGFMRHVIDIFRGK